MQGPNHLVTGILIQEALRKVHPSFIQYFLVAFLAIISHGILDRLAQFTYHPSMPLTRDWFWISYHIIIVFLTIFIFMKCWGTYRLGLIFSILPDFDWIMIHFPEFFSYQISFWKKPILHKVLFSFLDSLPPFNFLNTLPDWSLERKGGILEFGLFTFLIIIFFVLKKEGEVKKERTKKPALTVEEEKYIKSNDEKAVITRNWINILPIYQTCMDHEQMIRINYQSLLPTIEIGILGLFFTLNYLEKYTNILWLLPVAGILLCVFFGIACEYRARNVDIWRINIVRLVSGTEVEDSFKKGKYRWIPFGKAGSWGEYLFGHWFERILIPFIYLIWLFTLWYLPSPLLIRLCASLVAFGWILWAFMFKELGGSYYDYK